jgi:hypothetical protein
VLDNQQPEAGSEIKNTSTSPSDYSVDLTSNFEANKPSVGVSENLDKLDSKHDAKPLDNPLVLDNQQPEAGSEIKNTSTSPSDYSVDLTLNFAANKSSVGVSTLLLYSSTNSKDRDKLDSKYNAKPLPKPFSNRSSAISTTGYGEIPELLKNYPEEIIKQYSKIVGTGIQYGYKRGGTAVLTFLTGALGTRHSRR